MNGMPVCGYLENELRQGVERQGAAVGQGSEEDKDSRMLTWALDAAIIESDRRNGQAVQDRTVSFRSGLGAD